MIPTKRQTVEVNSTMDDSEVIQMRIDEDSLYHIMEVLRTLYRNQRFAILREYSANALDSHIEAGVNKPIKVTLPTANLAPFLKIQDFGVGMNADDIRNVYSKYGKSTKTTSNDVSGHLGLGSKSALAYTPQFTVIGIKGGVKTTTSVSVDEEGIGRMKIVDESPTDEGNGVEIIIPIKLSDIDKFPDEANQLFRFWTPGTVLVNDQPPEHYTGVPITDAITLVRYPSRNLIDRNYIIMGANPYPVDEYFCTLRVPDPYGIVARVPMGSVHVRPSRDALNYDTKLTKGTLQTIKTTFDENLPKAITREIDKAATRFEALQRMIEWRSAMPERIWRTTKLRYKGHSIPDTIESPAAGANFLVSRGDKQIDWRNKLYAISKHSRLHAIDVTRVPNALWIYGFEHATFTPAVKKKLWMYCDMNSMDYPPEFILCREKPNSPWIDPDKMLPWGPIGALKLPRNVQATRMYPTGHIPGSYMAYLSYISDTQEIEADDIDTSIPLYFIDATYRDTVISAARKLSDVDDDFTIVMLTHNRIAKFKRLFPMAKEYHTALREYSEIWWESLDFTERQALSLHHGGHGGEVRNILHDLPRVGIVDPDVRRAQDLWHQPPEHLPILAARLRTLDLSFDCFHSAWTSPFARYPLAHATRPYSERQKFKEHLRVYINAVYEYNQKHQQPPKPKAKTVQEQ